VPRGRAGDGVIPYTKEDLRFTTKGGKIYIFLLAEPAGPVVVKSLGLDAATGKRVQGIALVGSDEAVRWQQDAAALHIEQPAHLPSTDVISYRVTVE